MRDADQQLMVFLDLGDAFVKALAFGPARRERVRFPSVVASRLLSSTQDMTQLAFDERETVLRPLGFEPAEFPRARSYPHADRFVSRIRESPPETGARFAGRIAAIYGADRRLLGHDPSEQSIDALIHKALILLCASENCDAELVLIVDCGKKAESISRYAGKPERSARLELRTVGGKRSRRMELRIRARIMDAASCVARTLPASVVAAAAQGLLVIDIGYLRTKLAIVSEQGCEHQEELDGIGAAALVRRILRDGQDQGLFEDEFAVVQALESSEDGSIIVSGRRFAIEKPLGSARREIEDDLTRAVERVSLEHYRRRGAPCRAVAIAGGGAVCFGKGLERRLEASELGLSAIWIAPDPSFVLVEGARDSIAVPGEMSAIKSTTE